MSVCLIPGRPLGGWGEREVGIHLRGQASTLFLQGHHPYMGVCENAGEGGCVDLCEGGCVDLCEGGCVDLCVGGCVDLCVGGCVDLCEGGCVDLCEGGKANQFLILVVPSNVSP